MGTETVRHVEDHATSRAPARRSRRLRASLFAAAAVLYTLVVAPATSASAQTYTQLDCTRLAGAGSFSRPLEIGVVDRPTIVRGCPALTSGAGFNTRYYAYSTRRTGTTASWLGASFTLRAGQISYVHPRLATAGGWTVRRSLTDGVTTGVEPNVARWVGLNGLSAGRWIAGFEKLDSPLRSLSTPTFDIVIVP